MNRLATLFLGLRALVMAALAGAPLAQGQESPSADDDAWAAAVEAGTIDACQQYLEEFPAGRHAEEAFRCVVESQLQVDPAVGPELDLY
jgi:hypothetical protein